jgi:KDO2-lipid IV(A) lauroyltransferase
MIGWVMYWTWPTHARRLSENLRASAICASETEYRALLHETVGETGKAAVELAKVWFGPDREINKLVTDCRGWSEVEAALKLGKGIIFITPHLGCFEIAGQYIAQRTPLTVLYRPPRQKWVKSLIIAGRSREQLRLAPTDRRSSAQVARRSMGRFLWTASLYHVASAKTAAEHRRISYQYF